MSAGLLALFVAFGVLIGVLFGFFGMGGSFLVTPALLVMGYPSRVAVGSGLAFVFGTSVIATLKHRDLGQVDYKLGISMIIGTTVGLEVGKEIVLYLEELGLAGNIISVTYVLLLGGIGLFVTYEALKGGDSGGVSHDVDGDADVDADDIPELAKKIQSYSLPPMITLRGGVQVSSDDENEDGPADSDSDGNTSMDHSDSCFLLRIRPRITADRGASRHNVRV